MRITSTSYFNNIYGENNKLSQQLFDVNKQISSGQKIQYANEDPGIFIDTLRLDDEVTTLTQVKSSAQNAYKLTTQTDTTVGDIVKTLESIKVKMVNAASGTQSDTSMQAIAKELRGLQNHLMNLANTSIGGQYLFSGTATSQKPIAADGTYQGNDQNMEAFLGAGVKQKYNISGTQLFLGNESQMPREVTTNMPQKSLTDLYPDVMLDPSISRNLAKDTYITGSNTIRDLMGDTDANTTNDAAKTAYFYIQGTRTDGTAFKSKVPMNMTDTVDDLLHKIALAYDPNQANPSTDLVNVSLNAQGQIEISDKKSGSSKLDFHMVGALDFNPAGVDTANVTNIDSLQAGTTNFGNVLDFANPPVPPNPNANGLYIKEFIKSGNNYYTGGAVGGGALAAGGLIINGQDIGAVAVAAGDTNNALVNAINAKTDLTGVIATHSAAGGIVLNSNNGKDIVVTGTDNGALSGVTNGSYNFGALEYDKVFFRSNGAKLSSNVSQIVKSDNSYATESTFLGAVASGATYVDNVVGYTGLNGKVLKMQGNDVNGKAYDIDINLLDAGSTVTINSAQGVAAPVTFNLEDVTGAATVAGKVTYKQIMDVLNMATTNKLPPVTVAAPPLDAYNTAITNANQVGAVTLDYAGRIGFEDKVNIATKASISLNDTNSGNFANTVGSITTFAANDALMIRDPKKDFFAQIEQAIRSVEEGKVRPDGSDSLNPRNIGIQNSIQVIDDLSDHVSRMQTEVGSYSQVFQASSDRTDMLIISTKQLQSDVIDTDVAEATLHMQQLTLNYQALLSNISKVSKLSLVNYL